MKKKKSLLQLHEVHGLGPASEQIQTKLLHPIKSLTSHESSTTIKPMKNSKMKAYISNMYKSKINGVCTNCHQVLFWVQRQVWIDWVSRGLGFVWWVMCNTSNPDKCMCTEFCIGHILGETRLYKQLQGTSITTWLVLLVSAKLYSFNV